MHSCNFFDTGNCFVRCHMGQGRSTYYIADGIITLHIGTVKLIYQHLAFF